MAFFPHREMAVRLAQHRTEEARFFGEMRQVQSWEVPVFSEHRAAAKQPSFLAEQEQPFEEMRWLPPVLQVSERWKAGTSKRAWLFETMQQGLPPALAEQPVWAEEASQA
jgi:hypothetical protein